MSMTFEPEELTGERGAIEHTRNHLEFLTKSLTDLTARSNEGIEQSIQLKEKITLYRWSLYDFREATRRYAEIEERLFKRILSSSLLQDLIKEHKIIQDQLDKVIALAEDAVYKNLSKEELSKCASDIRELIIKLSEYIEAHSAKQDKTWKLLKK